MLNEPRNRTRQKEATRNALLELVARAAELFPSLQATEVIADCNHCPPTTDAFRQWLTTRITTFLVPA